MLYINCQNLNVTQTSFITITTVWVWRVAKFCWKLKRENSQQQQHNNSELTTTADDKTTSLVGSDNSSFGYQFNKE